MDLQRSLLRAGLPDLKLPAVQVLLRSILRWALARGMQGFEKADQRRYLVRGKILSISRHVAPTLQYLSHQLITSKVRGHVVQRRTALAADAANHVAVAALLSLKNDLALPAQRRGRMHIASRD